jgi:hypothetical protein
MQMLFNDRLVHIYGCQLSVVLVQTEQQSRWVASRKGCLYMVAGLCTARGFEREKNLMLATLTVML